MKTPDLDTIAHTVRRWQDHNFNPDSIEGALALCEEAGEVARAVLKEKQGIRPETRGNLANEIGDVLMCALALADRNGISPTDALLARLERMERLDFTTDPEGGDRR